MPRPKSEITGSKPRQLVRGYASGVNVRWTEQHHITFLRLGGSKWLRQEIEKHMKGKQCRKT